MEMKDSGKRQQFEGGAVRDTADGKPKMHLLSPHIYGTAMLSDEAKEFTSDVDAVLALKRQLEVFMTTSGTALINRGFAHDMVILAIRHFGVARLCDWLEKGAAKYEAFNWAKGMYITRCVDSLLRHMRAVCQRQTDEDHGAAICCNVMFIYHYLMEIDAGRLDPKWDDRFNFKLYNPQVAQSLSTLCTPLEVK